MIPLLAALLACDGAAEPEVGADPAPQSALDDRAYRFCHEPGADAIDARLWCDLLDDLPPDRCPGLRDTCSGAALPVAASSGCDAGSDGASGGGPSRGGAAGDPEPPRPRWQPEACQLPEARADAIGALGKWGVARGVAAVVLLVLRLMWSFFGTRREPPPVVAPVTPAPTVRVPDDDTVPALPGEDLLASARSALQGGDYPGAVLLARAATLRGLADRGLLKLHRARTDREYARSLRERVDLQAPLREVLAAVEAHRWGGAALDRARTEGAVAAADRVLRGLVALLALGLLAPDEARAQADRYGPNGDAGLRDALEAWGHDAGFRLRGFDTLDDTTDALVLDTTFVQPDDEAWTALRGWVERGGVLVVAGPNAVPELGDRVELAAPASPVAAPILGQLLLPLPRLPDGVWFGFSAAVGEPWVTVEGPDGAPLAVVVAVAVGEGVVVGVAEPRLLWNGALVHPDNERFLGDLLHAGQGALGWPLPPRPRVELATTAAAQAPSPTSSILNADLLAFVAQLLVTWALLGLSLGIPFALLRDPPDAGRIAFADHVRALGTRWLRLRASRHALAALGGLWLQRLGPRGLRQAAIRAGRDPGRADQLVAAVKDAVDDPAGPDQAQDLEWMEELWTITRNR